MGAARDKGALFSYLERGDETRDRSQAGRLLNFRKGERRLNLKLPVGGDVRCSFLRVETRRLGVGPKWPMTCGAGDLNSVGIDFEASNGHSLGPTLGFDLEVLCRAS